MVVTGVRALEGSRNWTVLPLEESVRLLSLSLGLVRGDDNGYRHDMAAYPQHFRSQRVDERLAATSQFV